jgi:hypothetical protein
MATLDPHNAPLIMSQCGSKGSPINIAQVRAQMSGRASLYCPRPCIARQQRAAGAAWQEGWALLVLCCMHYAHVCTVCALPQMVACVGQQSVGGKRCFNGFRDRTLPHYPRGDRTPAGALA